MGNWWDEQQKPTGSLASLQPTTQPPSVPAFDSAANNPYATQLAQGLQAYRNRPSRFSTEPASLPTPAQPAEASHPAGAWQTLKDIGGGLVETFRGIPGVVASSMEGVENPYAEVDWKDRTIEENRQRQQANLQALRDSGEFDRPMGLGMPFTRGEWAETTQSFPYTAATMGPALVGGAVGSAIGGSLGGLGGPAAPATVPAGVAAGRAIGGTLGGMLGAYLPAGSAATNQFIRDSLDKYRQDFSAKNGREPSPEEIDAHYKAVVEPQASRVYHGEAAPEAVGTVAELGLMKSAIGDVLNSGGSLPMRLAKAGGKVALSAFGIEPATETLTQQIQQPAYSATGLTDEAPRSLTSPEDWLKSAGEVYKQAAATSLFFSALGIPAGAMYGKYQQRREGNARVEDATQATADLRANLEFAREDDIATALTGFDQIETSGKLPKSAARRLDAARQQLIDELSLRAAPDALNEPLDTRRGQAGYLGFADRANELNDDQVFEAAQRPLQQDAPTELQDARARYVQEAKRRQDLNLAAAHFEQNPEAVDGVAKVLADIGDGKPLNKGGHGSVDYNLSSLSDDMLARYRMAGTVLLRDHAEALGNRAEKLNRTLSLLSEETERRASGQRRDPQAVREADIAQRIAKGAKNAKKLLTGLSPDAMERMASGLESRAQLEPGLADTAREIRALANKERARLFNPQGAKQPGIQSALRGWNQNQPNMPASQGQSLDQQIAADRARLSELAQQQLERQRQEKLADRTQAIQQQEADRRERLNAEIATRGRPGLAELARLLGPDTQLPAPRQEAPAPQSLSDLLNRPSQSSAVPTARAGERGSLSDLFPQQRSTNRNWWDTELSPSKVTTETPAPPKSGWARFGNETGTLNIPRAEMPQVKAEHRGALVNFLNARGVAHEADTEVDPATLKPTQAEFSPQKVRKAINYQGGDRSILVSSDGYVLDGHHQWLAALEQGKPIKAIRLDAPIANLLPLTREFPSSTVSTASNVRGGQTGRVETPTTAAPTQPETPSETRKAEAEAEAAPLLSQEAEQKSNAKKPKAKGVAPTWNDANEIERAAMISRSSEKAGAPVSNTFAQRKAAEWKTWADIPEGPAKKRLREYMTGIGKAENAPNRTESQEKEPDKKADIKPTKTSSKGASRNRAINATVDAGKDSILPAIAKIGGLDRAEAQRQGIDPAEFKRMPVFGKPVFRKNGGKSFDAMAESLSEFGYPVLDDKGQYSPNVLLDAISRELSGNPVYTPQGIEQADRRDAEEQAKFEQDNWLLDAVDLEHTGFDALNDQEQVTAQLQAEASRDLGEDAADTIFERISQQHEQATPEQFNEALRAAFNEARQRQSAEGREQAGEPGSVQAAGAILQDYSIEELRAEEERVAKAQADQAAKDNAAQQKTEADRARSDFVLTGSNRLVGNRLADVAMAVAKGRGQTNLLGAMKERPKTRFSRAALSPIAKEAISYFGTTSNLEEAGYVLPDGTLLDFSGRSEASKNDYRRDGNRWIWAGKGRDYLSNQRSMDHREVSKLPSINKSSTDAMLEFQRDAKALRIDMMSGRVSANFSDWSPAQMRAAMAIARNNDGSLTIDFDHPVTNRLIRSIDLDRASQAKINALLLEETNKDRRFSRNEISSSLSNSITKARAQLVAALNERSVAALERSGKLILHRTDPTRTGAAGYVDPKGAIHLIPSNMDQDALSVALHEAMHLARDDRFSEGNRAHIRLAHAALKITGLKNFIGNPGFSNLVQQLHRLAAEGNKTAIEALDKARREAPGNVEDEALAYLVQYADEKLPIVRRIIAAIRAALYRMGIKVKLNPADVRALALSALKSRAKDAALVQTARTQESFSLPEFAPTESDKAEVERQMKAVKEIRDGKGRLLAPNGKPSKLNERQWKQVRTQFFKDWFGDWQNDPDNASKVVDENGEPMVVYHGSPDARFMSSDATFKSRAERYGFGSPIGVHWFASSEQTAKTYADERRAFDYQNAEPGIVAAFLNIRDAIEINANGQKWREAQKVGKTSSVIDKAQTEGRDGVIIENVKDDYQTGAIKGSRATTTFSVFSSTQIKSAIGNAGTFSPRSNRIDYSQAADEAEQDQLWREFQAVRAQFQERQASQSAFERWFGQGVEGVNVHKGKPLTLFHGTNNPEFNRWDESLSGQASRHPTAGLGFFMTADARSAARYGSRLLELHAKINKPYFMTDADLTSIEDTKDSARFRRKLQAQGYDAAVISAPGGAPYVVALRSNQVKLASNDNPTENEDFRYSRPGGRQSSPSENPLPAETMGQAALRAVQDRFIRFQVIQDWLKQHGVNLTPDADVYGAESLLPKVTAARTQDAREKTLKPLIESAAEKKWSIQGGDLLAAIEDQQPLPTKFKPSIPEFLHAQHAIERNAQIAKIKGAPKDGSGLSDAQAHEILTRYRVMPNFSEFLAMSEKFRAITDQTRRILRTSGIISAEQEAAWTSAYKKYVPLKGGPDTASQQTGTGPGISVNPGMKRALGHRLRDDNIVENIWRDHERALYLSEKQKVTRALRNMLEQANNQNIGTVGQPEKKATLHQGYYHQVWIDGNPLGAYGSYNEAKAAISSDAQQSGRPLSKYAVVHKPADPAVVFMSRPMLADNEVALYENGQRIRLQLNDELLARAARNLGVDGASGLLKAAQSFNRWLSHAYTGYNPEFILANVARDMTTGMINLSGQYGGKFALKTLKGYGSAVRGLWKQIHGKADPWVDRYRAAGGSTGAAYLSDLERIGTDLKRIFQDYQGASETLRQGDRAGAARVAVSDKIRWLGGWIEKMNQVGENALRVATFRAMVEAGHSDAVSARAAGDVTVNFNRKGELTPTLGGLYLFFNPSIQGTKAMWDAMAKGAHRGQAMAMAGSLTLLALTLAELARGGDDADEEAWKRIPGYVKDRNLVIKMGDIQGTIPIPYGYGAFWSLGNILSDLSHGEDKTKAGIRFASSLFEQFSAIGNPFAGDEADIKNAVSLLPTALKPMMEIAMNRNSLGRPIMPEMSPWNTAQPDSARRWRSTTGSLYDGIASGLNRWTGGNAYQAGAIDISPETLSYLWRTFTGGAGKFAIDSMGLGTRIAQGVSPELREIPVLRKFVRAESIQDARTLFNEQSATVRLAVDAFNAAKRAKDLPAMRQMLDEQRQVLALGKVLQTAQKMIRARRELEDRINQSDLPLEEKRAQLKAIEKQESSILSRFTARFEKARQESR